MKRTVDLEAVGTRNEILEKLTEFCVDEVLERQLRAIIAKGKHTKSGGLKFSESTVEGWETRPKFKNLNPEMKKRLRLYYGRRLLSLLENELPSITPAASRPVPTKQTSWPKAPSHHIPEKTPTGTASWEASNLD